MIRDCHWVTKIKKTEIHIEVHLVLKESFMFLQKDLSRLKKVSEEQKVGIVRLMIIRLKMIRVIMLKESSFRKERAFLDPIKMMIMLIYMFLKMKIFKIDIMVSCKWGRVGKIIRFSELLISMRIVLRGIMKILKDFD